MQFMYWKNSRERDIINYIRTLLFKHCITKPLHVHNNVCRSIKKTLLFKLQSHLAHIFCMAITHRSYIDFIEICLTSIFTLATMYMEGFKHEIFINQKGSCLYGSYC